MVMAGRSKAEILSAIKAAFENRQLPDLESGAMVYMMSKSAYLTDEDDHNVPHLMFFTAVMDAKDWGSGAAGSRHAHVSTTMDQYGNPSALAKRKANRPIVQRLLQRPANQEVSIQ
jgi:hypothetical protein